MSKNQLASMEIKSFKGPYTVDFIFDIEKAFAQIPKNKTLHAIVDARVYELYKAPLDKAGFKSILKVQATEENKSLSAFTSLIERLLENGVKRGDVLVAVGGGITQDITCFLAATLFRGVDWFFVPTTLLAQADSCIGSKSSINVGEYKNLLGTFTPPQKIFICTQFLKTLAEADRHSGIGEMLKVHMIDSMESFKSIERDYEAMLKDFTVLESYISRSLNIKKRLIEVDEFDAGIRNILNYGHSFGHAIESATDFKVPHGVAVTMGMDMANFVAAQMGLWTKEQFLLCHELLKKNSISYFQTEIPVDAFVRAIAKDKKNTSTHLTLILPNAKGELEKTPVIGDEKFKSICRAYLQDWRKEMKWVNL